ncbi:MAG: CalY family protein [Patescibacteria group bacterium]|nr:CalY family protein [Patescibacteria group bacterium]
MKKILMSLLTIGAVGSLAFGATSAFFSDTETSTNNKIVAGQLDLKVDSTAHYAGMVCKNNVWADEDNDQTNNPRPELLGKTCSGTWTSTDLGPTNQFFNLSDVKPGDTGENTLSLTVLDNDAWACIVMKNLKNDENQCTEPESDPQSGNDTTCGNDPVGAGLGELAQNLYFTAWLDQGNQAGWQNSDNDNTNDDPGEGDNKWQGPTLEPLLFSNQQGPASDVLNGKVYALADSTNGNYLAGGVTNYIGLQWCAGQMTISGNTISCNGATMGNNTQTDSLTADVSIYVEQRRNNPAFKCAGANLLPN